MLSNYFSVDKKLMGAIDRHGIYITDSDPIGKCQNPQNNPCSFLYLCIIFYFTLLFIIIFFFYFKKVTFRVTPWSSSDGHG